MRKLMMVLVAAAGGVCGGAEAPAAWWRMDAAADGRVEDASGNGRALAFGPGCAAERTDVGPALRFDGTTNAWARFTAPPFNGPRTFAAWVRLDRDGPSVPDQKFTMLLAGTDFKILFDTSCAPHHSESVTVYVDPRQSLNRSGSAPMSTGVWQHRAWVWEVLSADADGVTGRLKYYRDGRRVGTGTPFKTQTPDAAERTVWLGNAATGLRPLAGAVADVRLYTRALSDAEIAAAGRAAFAPLPVPRDQARAVVEPGGIVAEDGYCGWPTVCRRKNGELLVAYSGARAAHIDPWGKVRLVRSHDNGRTWSEPETAVNSLIDDRDGGLFETREGTLVLTWFNSLAWLDSIPRRAPEDPVVRHTDKLPPRAELAKLCGDFTARSTDGGRTWTDITRTEGNANHGGIQLKDGRLLIVGRAGGKNHRLPVIESTDDGRSWRTIAYVEPSEGEKVNQFHEPHVVEFDDGRLLALFRFHAHDYGHPTGFSEWVMRQAESTDGGRTWTRMKSTGILGHPPHLLRTRGGKTVVVYAKRMAPDYGQYACVSDDEGRTWDTANEILLARGFAGDNGYPSTVELDDGTLYTVYYGAPTPKRPCCLQGVRWRLK